MNIFKGRPKLALTVIILVIAVGSYITVLFPHVVIPILLVVMIMTFLYVIWQFAQMISEDD